MFIHFVGLALKELTTDIFIKLTCLPGFWIHLFKISYEATFKQMFLLYKEILDHIISR